MKPNENVRKSRKTRRFCEESTVKRGTGPAVEAAGVVAFDAGPRRIEAAADHRAQHQFHQRTHLIGPFRMNET